MSKYIKPYGENANLPITRVKPSMINFTWLSPDKTFTVYNVAGNIEWLVNYDNDVDGILTGHPLPHTLSEPELVSFLKSKRVINNDVPVVHLYEIPTDYKYPIVGYIEDKLRQLGVKDRSTQSYYYPR